MAKRKTVLIDLDNGLYVQGWYGSYDYKIYKFLDEITDEYVHIKLAKGTDFGWSAMSKFKKSGVTLVRISEMQTYRSMRNGTFLVHDNARYASERQTKEIHSKYPELFI